MTMVTSTIRRGVATCLAASVVASFAAAAAAAGLSEIATMSGPDRQQKLEAGAKTEGEMNLYTTLIVDQAVLPLKEAFERKYPFVKFNYIRNSNSPLAVRILSEVRAGKPNADVVVAPIAPELAKAALLEPFKSPSLSMYSKEFIEPNGLWAYYRSTYYGIAYNTKLVSEADAPKGWEDMVAPKWMGKIVWNDSDDGAIAVIDHLRHIWGDSKADDYFKRLAALKVAVSSASRRTILDLVIAGEHSVFMGATLHHVMSSKSEGAPVWFMSPDPVMAKSDPVELLNTAPHPHAAILFIDFILGKEGQEALAKAQYLPNNPAVEPSPEMRPIIPYLNGKSVHVADEIDSPERLAELNKIFKMVSP